MTRAPSASSARPIARKSGTRGPEIEVAKSVVIMYAGAAVQPTPTPSSASPSRGGAASEVSAGTIEFLTSSTRPILRGDTVRATAMDGRTATLNERAAVVRASIILD